MGALRRPSSEKVQNSPNITGYKINVLFFLFIVHRKNKSVLHKLFAKKIYKKKFMYITLISFIFSYNYHNNTNR